MPQEHLFLKKRGMGSSSGAGAARCRMRCRLAWRQRAALPRLRRWMVRGGPRTKRQASHRRHRTGTLGGWRCSAPLTMRFHLPMMVLRGSMVLGLQEGQAICTMQSLREPCAYLVRDLVQAPCVNPVRTLCEYCARLKPPSQNMYSIIIHNTFITYIYIYIYIKPTKLR